MEKSNYYYEQIQILGIELYTHIFFLYKIFLKKKRGTHTVKMNRFQIGMQKSMTESAKIPTLYLKDEYDLTELVKLFYIYIFFFIFLPHIYTQLIVNV